MLIPENCWKCEFDANERLVECERCKLIMKGNK